MLGVTVSHVTPAQIAAVEDTFGRRSTSTPLPADFYRLAFAADPSLLPMFVSDPGAQRDRFAAELEEIVDSIRTLDEFGPRVRIARRPPSRVRRPRRALQGHGRRR